MRSIITGNLGNHMKAITISKRIPTVKLFWHYTRTEVFHFLDEMNGIFGFALYDVDNDSYFVARDHMGIIPLYMGWDKHGTFYVASELKALEGVCTRIELFPPGHYLHSDEGEIKRWYNPRLGWTMRT